MTLSEELGNLKQYCCNNFINENCFNAAKNNALNSARKENRTSVTLGEILYKQFMFVVSFVERYIETNINITNVTIAGYPEEYSNQILSIIKSVNANTNKNTLQSGASGAALGASLFGLVGLIGGAILGGTLGNNAANKDMNYYYSVFRNVIDTFFNQIYSLSVAKIQNEQQFKEIVVSTENKNKSKETSNLEEAKQAEQKLNNLIGLDTIKKQVAIFKALIKKQKHNNVKFTLHMCFSGNPGTGKTEVARLIADIFFAEGILPTNIFIETDRSGLVGEYLGQTAPKTHEIIKSALGGVLFIDEAYSLADNSSGYDQYGKEAIAALLKDMEDYRESICIILAGYKNEMATMFNVNPGFKSRINKYIDFPDYNLDELREITKMMIKKQNYCIDDDALEAMMEVIRQKSLEANFANAREVRNIVDNVIGIQALRTKNSLSNNRIISKDIEQYNDFYN